MNTHPLRLVYVTERLRYGMWEVSSMISDLRSLPEEKLREPGRETENEWGRQTEEKTWGKANRKRSEWYSGRDEEAHASLSEEVILAN